MHRALSVLVGVRAERSATYGRRCRPRPKDRRRMGDVVGQARTRDSVRLTFYTGVAFITDEVSPGPAH
ncbi:hypothetical protein QE152_g19441 [Popillia japonica]|uniref:Uncharacterized protein n=1 Tax=Popillia japonica TaxID=7064 RepID=A0AAW1KP50_POPJA